jgi:hypothetical protein
MLAEIGTVTIWVNDENLQRERDSFEIDREKAYDRTHAASI